MQSILMLALIISAAIAQEPPKVAAAPADHTLHSTLLLPKDISKPMPVVLLGNSFLSRFQMRRDNDQMVLERRY